ncbi:16332_t:CDS:1, partial [Gigaspora rosea]
IIFKVASHNINGIKNSNGHKLEMLGKWMETRDYAVKGLVESNVSAKEGYFLTSNLVNYNGFWSSSNTNKKKGSGVSLLVRKDWEKHLGQVVRYSEFMIEAVFYFKQLEIVIITVYLPPNDKDKIKRVQQEIVK